MKDKGYLIVSFVTFYYGSVLQVICWHLDGTGAVTGHQGTLVCAVCDLGQVP